MKKIITTFFVIILIFNINYSYAWSCLIKDSMAPSLSEYIKNTRKALNILAQEKTNQKNNIKGKINKTIWSISSSYNSIFNFNSYFSKIYLEFKLQKHIEVPRQLKRDLKQLKQIWEKIWEDMAYFLKNEKDSNIKDFCKDFSDIKCNISNNISKKELYYYLLQNYKKVETNVISTIIWHSSDIQDIELVWVNFNSEIETYYSQKSYTLCNNEDWGFLDIIYEKTDGIWESNKQAKDWIKKWKEAWALLIWKDMEVSEAREKEKSILKKWLSEEWVSGDSQNNMLETIDKYNSEWFSENNNFVSYSFNNISKKVNSRIKEFKEKIWDFLGKKETIDISIKGVRIAKQNSIDSFKIKERIETIYNSQMIFAWVSEKEADNLRSKLINMHLEIAQSINILKKSCKKSVKICKQQDPSRWNCWKCQ